LKKPLDSKPLGGIDLHIHSTASDGTCTPTEILQMAADIGLQAIAITDHDTLDGSRIALSGAIPENLRFITGVEISTQAPDGFPIDGSLHILGYGVDVDHPALNDALNSLQQARDERVPKIVERLNRNGIDITMDQVLAHVGDGSAGRPHVALALIENGVAQDVNDAFDRFLSKGQPGYVDKYRIPCRTALMLIREAGGVPVLAHPYLVPDDGPNDVMALVAALYDMGLMGIEAYYPHHTAADVLRYQGMADRFDLLITGGTDFHGDLIPDIRLGCGRGDLAVPYSLYEKLIAKVPRQTMV